MPEVDERVASLVFDNSEFDPEVKKSQKTLEEFEKRLDPKAFDKYAKNLNSQDFKPLNNSLSALGNTFKSLETIATGALLNIGMKMENFISSGIKSLTLDQATAGWGKYGSKVSSVQTIMAATSKQFKDTDIQMQYVSNQLETLNRFTDETSYSFVDMVNNIGKFTSKGIQLDTAVAAMEGISTWAALSGQGTESAAHAMYNLSQAIGQGYLKLIDWKSIQIANMDTVEFKETAIETAKALGTLKDAGDGTLKTIKGNTVSVKSFEQNLSDAWLTSEVLMKSLEKYGGFAQKLIESLDKTGLTAEQTLDAIDDYRSGTKSLDNILKSTGGDSEELRKVLEELGTEEYDLGRRAFRASYEAKTLAEAINYVKDAVSTGWTTSFEYIFGNYQEAKEFWTWFSNILYEIFVVSGETRNEILKFWHDSGGRAEMIEGLKALRDIFFELKEVARTVLGEIFPQFKDTDATIENTAKFLLTITRLFKNWAVQLKENEKLIGAVKDGARLFGIVLKIVLRVLEGIYIFFQPMIRWTKELISTLTKLIRPISNGAEGALEFVDGINAIRTAFLLLGAAIALPIKLLQKLIDWFISLGNKTLPELWEETKEWANNTWNAIKSLFTNIVTLGKNVAEGFKNGISSGFSSIGSFIKGIFQGVIDIVKAVLGIHSPSVIFASIGGLLISGLLAGLIAGKGDLKSGINEVFGYIISAFDFTGVIINKTFDNLDIAISRLNTSLQMLIPVIYTLANAILAIGGAIMALYAAYNISSFTGSLGDFIDSIYIYVKKKYKAEIIRQLGNMVLKIAISLAALAAIFAIFANMEYPNFKEAAIIMGSVAAGLLLFMLAMAGILKLLSSGSVVSSFSAGENVSFLKKLGIAVSGTTKQTLTMAMDLQMLSMSMIIMATAISILLLSVSKLAKELSSGETTLANLIAATIVFALIIASLTVMTTVLKKVDIDLKQLTKIAIELVLFSAILKVLANIIKALASIELPNFFNAIYNTTILLLALAAFASSIELFINKMPEIRMDFRKVLSSAIQLSAVAIVLNFVTALFNNLASIELPDFVNALINTSVLLLALIAFTASISFLINKLPKPKIDFGKMAFWTFGLLSFVWVFNSFLAAFSFMGDIVAKMKKIQDEYNVDIFSSLLAVMGTFIGFVVAYMALSKVYGKFKGVDLGGLYSVFGLMQATIFSILGALAIISKLPDLQNSISALYQIEGFLLIVSSLLIVLATVLGNIPNIGSGILYLYAILASIPVTIFALATSMLLVPPAMKALITAVQMIVDFVLEFEKSFAKASMGLVKFAIFLLQLFVVATLASIVSVALVGAIAPIVLLITTLAVTGVLVGVAMQLIGSSFVIAAMSMQTAARIFLESYDMLKEAMEKLKELFTADTLKTSGIISVFALSLILLGLGGITGALGLLALTGAVAVMATSLDAFTKVLDWFKTVSWESIGGMAKLALGLLALGVVMLIVSPGILTLAVSILAVAAAVHLLSLTFVILGNNVNMISPLVSALADQVTNITVIMTVFASGVLAVGAAFIVAGLGAIVMGLGLTVVAAATLALVVNALLAVGVLFLFDLLLNKIKEDNPELYNTIINVVSAIGKVITVTANLIKLLSPLFEAVIPIAIEVITTTYKIIKTVIMAVFNFFKAKWEELKNFWNTYIQPAIDVITGFIDKIYQGIKNKVDKFTQAGKDIIAGLIDGMTNNKTVYGLFKALTGISDDMIAEFRKSIDAHSPSLLYAEAGEDMMEGVEQGAQERAKSVYSQRAMQNSAKAQYEAYDKEIDSLISNMPDKFKKMGDALKEKEMQEYTANGKQNLEDIEKRESTERDKTLGGALGNIWEDVKKIFKQVKEGDMTLGDGLKALLESLKTHGGTFLGDKLDSLKNLIFGEGGPLSGFSDLLKNPFGNFEDIFKSLNLEEITKGIGDIDLGGVSNNVPDMSGLGGAGVGAGQGRQEQFVFTQNNYSPKALSRLEIYRQTKRQFNEFRVREELAK